MMEERAEGDKGAEGEHCCCCWWWWWWWWWWRGKVGGVRWGGGIGSLRVGVGVTRVKGTWIGRWVGAASRRGYVPGIHGENR